MTPCIGSKRQRRRRCPRPWVVCRCRPESSCRSDGSRSAPMKHSPALAGLIEALRALPGVGPKSAQRMAFHLLQHGRQGAKALSVALDAALERVGRCCRCRMLTEGELCSICSNPQRDVSQICVVESPADVVAIEQSGGYRGRYFVLMGRLSPLDGVGPEELGVREFEALLREDAVREVIL